MAIYTLIQSGMQYYNRMSAVESGRRWCLLIKTHVLREFPKSGELLFRKILGPPPFFSVNKALQASIDGYLKNIIYLSPPSGINVQNIQQNHILVV